MTHDWDLVERLLLEVRQSAHENFAPRAHAERLAEELCEGLENLARTGASDLTPVAYLGISAFAEGDSPADLLARADQALAQAEQRRSTLQSNLAQQHRELAGLLRAAYQLGNHAPLKLLLSHHL